MSTTGRNNARMTTPLTEREQAQLYQLLKRAGATPKPTRSTKEIRKILAQVPGDTVIARAKFVGVSRWTWYKWLAGDFRPSGEHAQRISRLTNVPLQQITDNRRFRRHRL